MALDPPIVELALSLHFVPLSGATVRDMVAVYEEGFASQYPTFQQVQRSDPLIVGPVTAAPPNFELMTGLELPRLWFVGSDTHDLVQFQDDRIVQNWRRLGPQDGGHEYPGYGVIRDKFARSFERAWEVLSQRGFAGPSLVSAELAYVNSITLVVGTDVRRIAEVLAFYKQSDPPTPITGFQAAWMEQVEAGWIHFATGFGTRPDKSPAINLTLSGRFDVAGLSLADALARFDMMHDNIHQTFKRVVTPAISESAYT